MMNEETLIAVEVNCETGAETVRPLTPDEATHREAHRIHDETRRAEKDAKEALESSERNALASWIAGHPDLPEAARNALARAAGIDTTTSSAL